MEYHGKTWDASFRFLARCLFPLHDANDQVRIHCPTLVETNSPGAPSVEPGVLSLLLTTPECQADASLAPTTGYFQGMPFLIPRLPICSRPVFLEARDTGEVIQGRIFANKGPAIGA